MFKFQFAKLFIPIFIIYKSCKANYPLSKCNNVHNQALFVIQKIAKLSRHKKYSESCNIDADYIKRKIIKSMPKKK